MLSCMCYLDIKKKEGMKRQRRLFVICEEKGGCQEEVKEGEYRYENSIKKSIIL